MDKIGKLDCLAMESNHEPRHSGKEVLVTRSTIEPARLKLMFYIYPICYIITIVTKFNLDESELICELNPTIKD